MAFVSNYHDHIYPVYRGEFHGIDPGQAEVFAFHHGLKRLDSRITAGLKQKDILDIGAFNGDSALVLSQYGRKVHSIEISETNIAAMRKVLAANPEISTNVQIYHMGIADKRGFMGVRSSGDGASLGPGQEVEVIPVDDFVPRYNLIVGFMKADIEGYAFQMALGARQTLLRDRPIFSFAVYHSFVEIYNLSMFLTDLLPNYQFEWHMENFAVPNFFELSFFGCPKELLIRKA
jgi:FkbM family methyltransferase